MLKELKLVLEVLILRQKNEGESWFIRSCPFLTHVTGIKIDSTAELSDRGFFIAFKETIKKMHRHTDVGHNHQ